MARHTDAGKVSEASLGSASAPRPEDWRVAEYRDQSILMVAFTAIKASGVADLAPPMPPVPVDDENLRPLARLMRDWLHGDDGGVAPTTSDIERHIRGLVEEVGRVARVAGHARDIGARADWRPWDSIRWWVAAGGRIAVARAAVVRMRSENEGRRAAWERGLQGPNVRIRGASDGRDARWEANVGRADRLELLLVQLRQCIGADSAPFWCADQAGPLRLTDAALEAFPKTRGPAADRLKRAINSPASSRRDHLEKLVAFCGFPTSIDNSFRELRSRLAAEAGRLLAAPCVAGEKNLPDRDSASLWRVVRGSPQKIIEKVDVLGPPLFVAYPDVRGPRPVADGVILIPQAAAIAKRLREWSGPGASPGMDPDARVRRAGELVGRVDWGEAPKFTATLCPSSAAAIRADVVVTAWLACGRLLVEAPALSGAGVDPDAASLALSPPREFHLAALLEGIELVPDHGECVRRIPFLPDEPQRRGPRDALALRVDGRRKISIGFFETRPTCAPETLEFVDEIDWQLWAIHAVVTSPFIAVAETERTRLRDLLTSAGYGAWEEVKCALLGADGDPAVIATAVGQLHEARLRLDADASAGPTATVLAEAIRRGIATLLPRLHAIDPSGLGGLHPPRRADDTVDVFRWRTSGTAPADGRLAWEAAWSRDATPFGTQVGERVGPRNTVQVTFSASSSATDADIALLGLALDTVRTKGADDACSAPLVRVCLALLQPPADGAEMPDVAGALASLREGFAGRDHDAFDALIKAATAAEPEPAATRWVRLLRDDVRFGFECYPPIESTDDGRTFHVGPVSSVDEPWLEWQDADDVAPDADVSVVHAQDPGRATRVLSRGRPGEDSTEQLASTLEAIVARELPALSPHARTIRRGIDLRRAFPNERPRWTRDLVAAIGAVLDGVVRAAAARSEGGGADMPPGDKDPLGMAFETVSRIGDRCGHPVTPVGWNVRLGAAAAAVTDVEQLAVAFHPTVPAGAVIVDRFGIDGDPGRGPSCRRSAGRSLDGFDRLKALVDGLTGDGPRFEELRRGIADLPRHVLGEKSRLAIPSLYASVWHVLIEHPAVAGDPAPWREAVAELIRKPYDMVMFEPAKLGDYPAGWIVGPDGKPPRGRRIARVVRPGVRTLDKKLVWPAIVETE